MAKTARILQFRVVIEQDENGWYVASVPDLVGCYTQGKTLEQVRQRIKEAIELVLESEKDAIYGWCMPMGARPQYRCIAGRQLVGDYCAKSSAMLT